MILTVSCGTSRIVLTCSLRFSHDIVSIKIKKNYYSIFIRDPEGKSGCNYKETYFCFPTTFSKIGFPERLDTVIDWLTLPEEKRPDIVTLYFDEPDHAGHQKGPESEMVGF